MMQPSQPAWLAVEEANQPLKVESGHNSSGISGSVGGLVGNVQPIGLSNQVIDQSGKTPDQERNAKMLYWARKALTMCLCCLMSATAIVGCMAISGVDKSGKVFVGTYMFFFSGLLFIFEANQILPPSSMTEKIDHMYRRNFGFLYSCMGKSFFIIFIAFLSFGLGDPMTLTLSTGICWAAYGAGEISLYLKYPELFSD